jgi:hypothetical protein
LPINPAHEIVIGNVPHEQEQAVRHLVEVAVAQRVAGQGASIEVPGLGTRSGPLVISAVIEPPVTAKLRACWVSRQRFGNLRPADAAVLVHVPSRDRIRNSLKAQRLDQPIKQDRSVMIPDGATDAAITQIGANVVEIRC